MIEMIQTGDRKLTAARITFYVEALQKEERAAATISNYLRNIHSFAAWLDGRPVTKELAAAWKACLLAEGRAPVTVNAKLSALNGLFRFLGWRDCQVRFLKIQRRVFRDAARDLRREEYLRLLSTARLTGQERTALLMETICASGIRVSELQHITVEAARLGWAEISLKGQVRTILLPGKLCRKLLKYANRKKIASGEIFVTRGGNSLSRRQIWREMKALCQQAGVAPSKVFPHNLRHLFAATFYRASRDIVKLADLLGHSSINTTRIYLLATGTEHARQLEKLGLVT